MKQHVNFAVGTVPPIRETFSKRRAGFILFLGTGNQWSVWALQMCALGLPADA
jgi:hypothetical protein